MVVVAGFDVQAWVLTPLLILVARVVDMSLDTMRVILLGRGARVIAPLLGFVEVLIWLLAIRQVFTNLDNPACFLAYAAGFALGNHVGMRLEARIALGVEVLRVITRQDASELVRALHEDGHGLTVVPGQGRDGPVSVLFMLVRRREIPAVLEHVERHNPRAFYSIEDVRFVREGVFRPPARRRLFPRTPVLK